MQFLSLRTIQFRTIGTVQSVGTVQVWRINQMYRTDGL